MKQLLLFDREILRAKVVEGLTPGLEAEFDSFEADAAGAFAENALNQQDVGDSTCDTLTLDLFP